MRKKECHERLAELLSITGTTQADMVERTGINKSVISQYVNGRRLPRQDKLALISEAYNVDPAWLMGFDVPMERKNTAAAAERDFRILHKFSMLSARDQAIIESMMDQMLDHQ